MILQLSPHILTERLILTLLSDCRQAQPGCGLLARQPSLTLEHQK
uniref:Uncharacterized protein n=1 Tax=Anguilla anguilla TaxID=7936 RepID=A0A0E9W6P7_ANGAN